MAKYGDKGLQELTAADIEETGIPRSKSGEIHKGLRRVLQSTQGLENLWNTISQEVLAPGHPHALHRLLYYSVYKDWNSELLGPPPAWTPSL